MPVLFKKPTPSRINLIKIAKYIFKQILKIKLNFKIPQVPSSVYYHYLFVYYYSLFIYHFIYCYYLFIYYYYLGIYCVYLFIPSPFSGRQSGREREEQGAGHQQYARRLQHPGSGIFEFFQ